MPQTDGVVAPRVGERAHLPGLDGVRGFAILAVIVHHVCQRLPQGSGVDAVITSIGEAGWFGVDLFFVLSGFLITGILIDQRGQDDYYRTFYFRRVLRIVPVYIAFLAFSLWIAPVVGVTSPEVAHELRATQGWYWSYAQNILFALRGFPPEGGPSHLWSLAVEEQFYLVWPFAVAFAAPRTLPKLAIGCIAFASLCRMGTVLAGAQFQVAYVLLPTRMDALAIGAFLACAVRDPALLRAVTRSRTWVMAAALVLLVAESFVPREAEQLSTATQLVGFPAIALVCGLVVLIVAQSQTLLTNRVLRFFGRYSYGLYLWHFLAVHALLVRTRALAPYRVRGSYLAFDAEALAIVLVVSVLVALASWHVIEQPFLRLKRYVPYASGRKGAVAGAVAATSS